MEEEFAQGGFLSPEEHMQEYLELFLLLQQGEEAFAAFAQRCGRLEEREQKTDIFLPALYLRECLQLNRLEYWTVMFAFCLELEEGLGLNYRKKYGSRSPGLSYVLQLLSPVFPADFAFVARFCGGKGALGDILEPAPERAGGEQEGLLLRPLRLHPAAFFFLLTGELPEQPWYQLFPGEQEEEPEELLPLHEREYKRLCVYLEEEGPLRLLLRGREGCGCRTLLRRACLELCENVVFVKTEGLPGIQESAFLQAVQSLRLMVRLFGVIVVLEPGEGLSAARSEEDAKIRELFSRLGNSRLCLLVRTGEQAGRFAGDADVTLALQEELTGAEKRLALDARLGQEQRRLWQETYLDNCALNMGELKKRLNRILLLAKAEGLSAADPQVWETSMRAGQEPSAMGRLIRDRYQAEDLILPEECRRQLDTVIRLAKVWRGEKGLQLMFHGSSGTGKTMAASVLAGQLQLPLFKVDLAQVFDKYIGETEKHVDEIFRMARRNHYLLFFDEADALFAKRTAVRDSHDRYANVSAAYLLQRMEEYDGILILATNLRDHFDDAFVRRIRFVIKFRSPDRKVRERLWRKALERELPVDRSVDYGALADAAELSPARICAAARVAGLLAVCGGNGAVTGDHIREALELEAGKDETVVRGF